MDSENSHFKMEFSDDGKVLCDFGFWSFAMSCVKVLPFQLKA